MWRDTFGSASFWLLPGVLALVWGLRATHLVRRLVRLMQRG